MVRYSVIIPSYNDGRLLLRCLNSLCALPEIAGELEIVVALDGSTDNSAELLALACEPSAAVAENTRAVLQEAKLQPGAWRMLPLRVVELKQNQGRSAARNAAVNAASGEWLLFLDADLRVSEDWVRVLHAGLGERSQIGIGSMVYETQAGSQLKRYQIYLQGRGPAKLPDGAEVPARHFYTCNSLVHRELFERTGGFDERLRVWGGEDIDMGLKLEAAGARMWNRRGARALHAQERSFAAHCRNLAVFGERVIPLLLERHPQLYEMLQLGRVDAEREESQPLLRLLCNTGFKNALLQYERWTNGFLFRDRIYDLIIYLHYASGYLRSRTLPGKENK